MAGKPGKFESWFARLAATKCPRERDDLKANALGIRESELVLAVECEPVALMRYAVQAPRAQPIPGGILDGGRRLVLEFRLEPGRNLGLRYIGKLPVHDERYGVKRPR